MADEKIIQAAAEAIANRFYAMAAGEAPEAYIEPNAGDMDLASAVVAAIEPLIREQIATELRRNRVARAKTSYSQGYRDGYNDAADQVLPYPVRRST